MRTVAVSDAVEPLADYARKAADGPVIVTDGDTPIAAVVPLPLHGRVGGPDYETLSLRTNLRFLALLDQARERLRKAEGVPFEEMCRRLGVTEADLAAASPRRTRRPRTPRSTPAGNE
jgi:antitoxin (DNA-binding transcriptional repressor) of toxin-antitoxin stability system